MTIFFFSQMLQEKKSRMKINLRNLLRAALSVHVLFLRQYFVLTFTVDRIGPIVSCPTEIQKCFLKKKKERITEEHKT